MSDPELCDVCLATPGYCRCEYVPPQGERRPARTRRALCAEIARDDTAGHDPGGEHDGGTP